MRKNLLSLFVSISVVFLSGCNNDESRAFLDPRDEIIPIDTNIAYGDESGTLYYADPRPEENGLNRALRIDYLNMRYEELACDGVNPHSIDRAGTTQKFYMRTQNSYSFDVVNFQTHEVRTIDMNHTRAADGSELYHRPRAIGAYNKTYNIQLLSVKNRPAVDVIDVKNDEILTVLGDNSDYNLSEEIVSNGGSGSATGHALWFDEDHLGVVDRVHSLIWLYRVEKDASGKLRFTELQRFSTEYPVHVVERVEHAKNEEDTYLFYSTIEGDVDSKRAPEIIEIRFDPFAETLEETGKRVVLAECTQTVDSIKPTTHHLGITPDGKKMIVPVFDGHIYIIDRESFQIEKILVGELGAAHVNFSERANVAIVTNHFSRYVTIIDLKDFEIAAEVEIGHHAFDPDEKHLLQPHFSYVDPDGRYFYTFATQDGDFVKIDLETHEVVERLHTGGAPEQAHS